MLVLIILHVIVFTLHSQLMNALSQATASSDSPEAFAPVTRNTVLHNFTSPIIKVSKKKVQASNKESLPQWMKNYFDWHKKQMSQLSPSNWKQQKFLVLSCLENQSTCGGLSDRLKPLPLFLYFANQTGRIFMIRWDKPYALEEFLQPNELNWSMPQWIVNETEKDYGRPLIRGGTQLRRNLPTDQHCVVYGNIQDFHGGGLLYDELITEAYNATKSTDKYKLIYHDLFRYIFKPSPPVQKLVEERMKHGKLTPGEYSIAHYRAFYAIEHKKEQMSNKTLEVDAVNIAKCGSVLRPGGPVYFASDSVAALNAVQRYAKEHNKHIVTFDGPDPPHIDKDLDRNISDYYSIFVDLYMMGNGRCVAFGKGGFGRYALMMGYNSSCEFRYLHRKSVRKCEWID